MNILSQQIECDLSQFCQDEKGSGNWLPNNVNVLNTYWSVHLKNGYDAKFMLYIFYHNEKYDN